MVKMHKICSLLGIPIDQATPCNIYICNDIEIDCIAFETTEYLFVDFTTVDFSYVEMFQLPREYHVAGWRIQYLVSTQKIIIPIRIINDIYGIHTR